MRYRLRTLLVVLAFAPPLIGGIASITIGLWELWHSDAGRFVRAIWSEF